MTEYFILPHCFIMVYYTIIQRTLQGVFGNARDSLCLICRSVIQSKKAPRCSISLWEVGQFYSPLASSIATQWYLAYAKWYLLRKFGRRIKYHWSSKASISLHGAAVQYYSDEVGISILFYLLIYVIMGLTTSLPPRGRWHALTWRKESAWL